MQVSTASNILVSPLYCKVNKWHLNHITRLNKVQAWDVTQEPQVFQWKKCSSGFHLGSIHPEQQWDKYKYISYMLQVVKKNSLQHHDMKYAVSEMTRHWLQMANTRDTNLKGVLPPPDFGVVATGTVHDIRFLLQHISHIHSCILNIHLNCTKFNFRQSFAPDVTGRLYHMSQTNWVQRRTKGKSNVRAKA